MNQSKTLLVFVLSLMCGLILVACGGTVATETAVPAAPLSTVQSAPATAAIPATAVQPQDSPTEAPADAPAPAEAPAGSVSFANDVMPILQSRCLNCHGGERVEAGLNMGSYEEILAGSENGTVIVPGDAANSLLVELVTNQKMPKRGPKLTPPQMQLITDWVNSGAPNN
jgi:mono/diheme cytochrome c family protein